MSDKAKFRIGGLCILEAFLLFGSGMTLMNQEYVNLGATQRQAEILYRSGIFELLVPKTGCGSVSHVAFYDLRNLALIFVGSLPGLLNRHRYGPVIVTLLKLFRDNFAPIYKTIVLGLPIPALARDTSAHTVR